MIPPQLIRSPRRLCHLLHGPMLVTLVTRLQSRRLSVSSVRLQASSLNYNCSDVIFLLRKILREIRPVTLKIKVYKTLLTYGETGHPQELRKNTRENGYENADMDCAFYLMTRRRNEDISKEMGA